MYFLRSSEHTRVPSLSLGLKVDQAKLDQVVAFQGQGERLEDNFPPYGFGEITAEQVRTHLDKLAESVRV